MRIFISIFLIVFCHSANAVLLTDPEGDGFDPTSMIITSERVFYGCDGVEKFLKTDYVKLINLYEKRVKLGVDKRYKKRIKERKRKLNAIAKKISNARDDRKRAVT